ncbi:nuclear transport factor 2 family protein [Streptomyces sp. NPDC093675]|uniref:nuclear transport factor 2 family protein n=1 Tax=Streptomyces sp. NPDC093675 TaxID=3366049 RepID=UPI00381D2CE4
MKATSNAIQWAREFFALIDAGDGDSVAGRVAIDAVLTSGNGTPVVGRDSIRATLDAFHSSVTSISHDVVRAWRVDEAYIVELQITYVRTDGGTVVLPCVNILDVDDHGLITKYQIFMDISPVFA